MKKQYIQNLFAFSVLFMSLFFLFNCSQDNSNESSFDIYLIKDSGLDILEFDCADIGSIDLPDNPVISICDIDTYKVFQSESNLSLSHRMKFKSNMKEKFGNENCYFILVVNGARMYKGEYWANFMDTYLQNVLIYPHRDDEFHITTVDDADKINNSRIMNALIESGVNVIYQNIE